MTQMQRLALLIDMKRREFLQTDIVTDSRISRGPTKRNAYTSEQKRSTKHNMELQSRNNFQPIVNHNGLKTVSNFGFAGIGPHAQDNNFFSQSHSALNSSQDNISKFKPNQVQNILSKNAGKIKQTLPIEVKFENLVSVPKEK
mmetsp:Transcript_12057/g.11931  ORF Transcript_12057/g.11931 Transcript_12057/m.11931 type:complete len:143 (-) Transcript_12057:20-448(-)